MSPRVRRADRIEKLLHRLRRHLLHQTTAPSPRRSRRRIHVVRCVYRQALGWGNESGNTHRPQGFERDVHTRLSSTRKEKATTTAAVHRSTTFCFKGVSTEWHVRSPRQLYPNTTGYKNAKQKYGTTAHTTTNKCSNLREGQPPNVLLFGNINHTGDASRELREILRFINKT